MNVVERVRACHDDDVCPVAFGECFEFVQVRLDHRLDG